MPIFENGRPRHTYDEWIIRLSVSGWKCYWCGDPLTERTATKDHLQPQCRGGSDEIENIRPACIRCNSVKGMKNEEEFRRYKSVFSSKSGKKFTGAFYLEEIASKTPQTEREKQIKAARAEELRWSVDKSPYFNSYTIPARADD